MTTNKPHTNELIYENSPYLLQHANNPVNWHPWGQKAFILAKAENKPIFLSIGYSTCHWCHIMERESFEDHEVAALLNNRFIAIKVDKEERPDIDTIYMTVCQAMTGGGGWPLTIIMTPDQKPFFAGTYFPKKSTSEVLGLLTILNAISQEWVKNPSKLIDNSNTIVGFLQTHYGELKGEGALSPKFLKESMEAFESIFDPVYGGFGPAPKFPMAHNLLYLMTYGALTKNSDAINMVTKTLDQMVRGGLYDHIGFGFSRYSTDEKWAIPHFEKMLYDNALLVLASLDAFQITKDLFYKTTAKNTLTYIIRELRDPAGGFYCAQDADSQGVEGKYYGFTPGEVYEILGLELGQAFNHEYDITSVGNFENMSIPNLIDNENFKEMDEKWGSAIEKLYEYRLKRIALHRDDKILTSWNGLMIAAFAKAYKVLGNSCYYETARDAIQFIESHLVTADKKLQVRYRNRESIGHGLLEDYAFYIFSLLEMFEATLDPDYLKTALFYTSEMVDQFFDQSHGGFFMTPKNSEALIYRPMDVFDGAMPSGNSVATYVLVKLSQLTDDPELNDLCQKQLSFMGANLTGAPAGRSFANLAFIKALMPTKEIVCVLKNVDELESLKVVLRQGFHPNTQVIVITPENRANFEKLIPTIVNYRLLNGEITFYICENKSCSEPFNGLVLFAHRWNNQI